MKIISHRGYENGEDPFLENNPKQIKKLLNMNIDVEIDVLYNGAFYLGHDEPLYEVELDFLKQDGLWCHAKNIEALELMLKNDIHCFWHESDKYTITSKGHVWVYPGMPLCKGSVYVLPEKHAKVCRQDYQDCYAVCTDFPLNYLKE
jgi:hypothetical protein